MRDRKRGHNRKRPVGCDPEGLGRSRVRKCIEGPGHIGNPGGTSGDALEAGGREPGVPDTWLSRRRGMVLVSVETLGYTHHICFQLAQASKTVTEASRGPWQCKGQGPDLVNEPRLRSPESVTGCDLPLDSLGGLCVRTRCIPGWSALGGSILWHESSQMSAS